MQELWTTLLQGRLGQTRLKGTPLPINRAQSLRSRLRINLLHARSAKTQLGDMTTVLATVLGSGIAALDGTVVGIALPAIGRQFRADVSSLQWIVTGYTLSLAGLLLLGGALGDRFGRRRLFVIGVVWFAAASLLCGTAPTSGILVAARI